MTALHDPSLSADTLPTEAHSVLVPAVRPDQPALPLPVQRIGTLANSLFRVALAMLVLGPMAIAFNLAIAAIIYQGPLVVFLDRAIALTLTSAAVMATVGAFLATYRGTVFQQQNVLAVILSLSSGAIAAGMADPASETSFATVAALVGLATLTTGATALLIGSLRLGSVARFIPFPVLSGFLASTGYLLVTGGLGMALGRPVNARDLTPLFDPGNPVRWLPWTLAAVVIIAVMRRTRKPMALPLCLFVAGAAFYATLAVLGLSLDDAERHGLLLGPFGETGLLPSLAGWQPLAVDTAALIPQIPHVLALVGLSIVGAVMSASSLEVAIRSPINPDRDLRAVGFANLAAPFGGGGIAYHSISQTTLAWELGVTGRMNAGIAGAACLLALTVGAPVISALPVGLLTTTVIVTGLALLLPPLIDQRRSLPARDYAVVLLITAVTAMLGFLPGVAVGLVAAALFFVVTFARIDVVRLATTGARLRSRLERPDPEQARLAQLGRMAAIYSLGGYIFFGTAHRLAERVEAALHRAPQPRFVVLDFRRVTGLDTSAARALARLGEVCRRQEVALYLAGLAEPAARLILAQMPVAEGPGPILVARLDDALEAVESRLLAGDPGEAIDAPGLVESLRLTHPAADLDGYFRTVAVPAGAEVIAQGAASDSLFVLCSGVLRAEVADKGGASVTVARCLPGALIGEIGFYADMPRTARVVAEAPCELLRIDAAALDRMGRDDPALLADFHRAIAARLAHRLRRTTALLADAELLGR